MHYKSPQNLFQHRWSKWSLAFAFWTFCGIFFALQTYLINVQVFGQELPWTRALPWSLSYWYTWAILSPLIVWLAKLYAFDQQNWKRALLIHLPASLGLAVVHLMLIIALNQIPRIFMGTPFTFGEKFWSLFAMHFHWNVFTYWMIVAFSQTVAYYEKYRERELHASQIEAQLARSELQALRMQLHPHFLFNTLNSISSLMYTDVEAADSMLSRLSHLLRSRVEGAPPEVRLKEELEFLEEYLDIERMRFADRLTVRLDIPHNTLDALVPNLVLQPLVENAIRHGIAPREEAGLIEITARLENGNLLLQVRDNGPGFGNGDSESQGAGIGLSNTRERLRRLYGPTQSLDLLRPDEGGTVALLTIPFNAESNK